MKYVLNTHWHGDHTGGNAYFGKSAVIIAQDDVRKTMQTESDRLGRITNLPVSVPVLTFPKGHSSSDTIVFTPASDAATPLML